jgi:pyruvate dehydrogenase E2 component (dihydrolipoamide acetyltransferase)
MVTDIVMPNLGFDAQSGLLVEWLKQSGDYVQKGEPLAVIESDKANVEFESVSSGTIIELCYTEGDEIPIGSVIARLGDKSEQSTSIESSGTRSPQKPVSPVASRIAQEHDIDLSNVVGTGSGGKITKQDVEQHIVAKQTKAEPATTPNGSQILALPKVRRMARQAGINLQAVLQAGYSNPISMLDLEEYQNATKQPAKTTTPTRVTPSTRATPPGATHIELNSIQKRAAQRISKSKQDAPHFYVSGEFDLEDAIAYIQDLPGNLKLNDLVQYLVVLTLQRVPQLNARYENGELYQYDDVNLSMAVALEDGLITPTIQHAQDYSLQGLANQSRGLIKKARDNRLAPTDLQGGTFTVSNLGVIKQVDHFTAVINPPQVAIVAIGTVKKRPVVINDGLHLRHTVWLTVSGDHRVVDGMALGKFLQTFQSQLNNLQV